MNTMQTLQYSSKSVMNNFGHLSTTPTSNNNNQNSLFKTNATENKLPSLVSPTSLAHSFQTGRRRSSKLARSKSHSLSLPKQRSRTNSVSSQSSYYSRPSITLSTSSQDEERKNDQQKQDHDILPPQIGLQPFGNTQFKRRFSQRGSLTRNDIQNHGANRRKSVNISRHKSLNLSKKKLSVQMSQDVDDDASDSEISVCNLIADYFDEVLQTELDWEMPSRNQIWFSGSHLKYYKPIVLDTFEEVMNGKDIGSRYHSEKRNTAPDINAVLNGSGGSGSGGGKGWLALASRKSENAGGDSKNSSWNRISVSSEPEPKTGQSRRSSLTVRSTSLVERPPEGKASFKNTRKFIYSLAKMAGKTAKSSSSEESPRKGYATMLARSAGVRLMLRRQQLMGGSRMAALGSLLAARKRLSLADHVLVRFDAKMVWRKVRLWVRIRAMLKRMHEEIKAKVTHDPSSPLYMIQLSEEESMGIDRNHYMFFDPTDFKANRQMRTSGEVKRIMSLPPEQRSPEEIHCAMIGLRAINTIAEYPVRMQRYLAEYGYFQGYEAKRAIVRQGRPPEAFYYVLYGRVLVAVRDEVTGRVEIKCYLHRGHSFGELAIIRHTARQSTVITKNYTELLCLPSEIFQKYFMIGGVKNLNDPDQVHFIQSLSFLRGWPVELILDASDQQNLTFGYFKRGSILSRDTNYSDWLIIVKSGSLTVLKKLVKAKPTASRKTGLLRSEAEDSILGFLDNGREYMRSIGSDSMMTPFSMATTYNDADGGSDEDELSSVTFANRPHTSIGNHHQPGSRMSFGLKSPLGKNKSTNYIPDFKADNLLLRRHKTETLMPSKNKMSRNRAVSRELSPEDALELDDKRTFLDDLDSTYCSKVHTVTEADVNPQFVYVQTLTKGDVFGLAQCLFCDQPSLCVVSNGADCILMNKKLFLDNCSSEIIRRLRVEVSPYPSEEKLQQDLVTRINWDVYKGALRKQIYTQHNDKLRQP